MQFSYKVSEADYGRALKLRRRQGFGGKAFRPVFKIVAFWVFVMICLMLLWAVIQKTTEKGAVPSRPDQTQSSETNPDEPASASRRPSMTPAVIYNVGPFILIGVIWIFILFRLGPRNVRGYYRKDPAMQGTYTIDVTPALLSIQNTAGISMQTGWNLFEYWVEEKGTMILGYKSGAYFIISLDPLSDAQRAELRGILGSMLPRK